MHGQVSSVSAFPYHCNIAGWATKRAAYSQSHHLASICGRTYPEENSLKQPGRAEYSIWNVQWGPSPHSPWQSYLVDRCAARATSSPHIEAWLTQLTLLSMCRQGQARALMVLWLVELTDHNCCNRWTCSQMLQEKSDSISIAFSETGCVAIQPAACCRLRVCTSQQPGCTVCRI